MVLAVMSILAVNGVSVASQEMSAITGKVVETMNSGGYTYVCLEKSNKKNLGCHTADDGKKRSDNVSISRR